MYTVALSLCLNFFGTIIFLDRMFIGDIPSCNCWRWIGEMYCFSYTFRNLFMPPNRMIEGILILSCLFVCLAVVNFYLRYNFWTVRGKDVIFGMRTPLMRPFQMIFDREAKNSFLDFVAAGGIVFYKHTLIFHMLYYIVKTVPNAPELLSLPVRCLFFRDVCKKCDRVPWLLLRSRFWWPVLSSLGW